jgi:glycosyltransferase involved in cell wall biosynthesis
MRICHVIESASGGSAGILVSLALHAVRRGHEVHVVYSPDRAETALINALAKGGCASARKSRMRRSVGPHDVADGMRLRKVLSSLGRLDVIHSHSSKAGALARTFGRVGGAAQIYSPHGFYTMTGEAPFYIGPVERALSWTTDRIIAVSEFEKRHAVKLGIAPKRVTVVVNGVEPYEPLSPGDARHELGLGSTDFVVGFVGRLTAQKAPLAAIDAITGVQTSGASLVFIGDGDLRAEAAKLSGCSLPSTACFAPADMRGCRSRSWRR